MDLMDIKQKNWDQLWKHKNQAAGALDKIVFVVSTGSFALTITLLGFLKESPIHPYLLIASWFFLGLTVALHAYGYYVAVEDSDYGLNYLNKNLSSASVPETDKKHANFTKQIRLFNLLSYVSLVIGILLLGLFTSANLLEKNATNSIDSVLVETASST